MWKEFYKGMDFTALPLFALFFFLAVFAGVFAWVYLARRASDFDKLAALPLDDLNRIEPRGGGTT